VAIVRLEHEGLSRRDKQWNFAACLTDAVGWPLGAALISTVTILPLFLKHLGAGNIAVGALPALYNLLIFAPGLWLAGYISRLRRARGYLLGIALLERLALLPLGVLTLLWGDIHREWLLWVTFGCIGVHALMMGLNQPAYWVVIGKCIPAHWRGRLFGLAGGLSGLLGLGMERLLRRFLSGPHGGFPLGYGHAFLLGFALMTVSVLPLGAVREPVAVHDDPHAGHYWHDSLRVWRGNPGFRRFLRAQIAVALASLSVPFFILDAAHRLHAGGATAGYTATLLLTSAFGGMGWGAWSDHVGNKRVVLMSALCLAVAPVLAVVAPSGAVYYGVFGLSALGSAGVALAGNNIVMEYAGSARDIPLYTALYNIITALPRAAAPLVGGWFANSFGYGPVFLCSAFLGLIGFALTLRAGEPRHTENRLHVS
jgi:MFS family permease